ncbi:hypothetical protein JYU23_01595, partial [bacterium AH-315-C07]|nr:hypothetical protein [bacterium AH-315-C07]
MKGYIYILLLLGLFIPALSFSFDLRCVSVNANGSVVLTWANANDSVYVYRKVSTNFTLIDSVANPSQSIYTDNNINALTSSSVSYFLQSQTNTSNISDTLQIIDLNLNSVLAANGIGDLSWNQIRSPLLPTSYSYYYILREFPLGTWKLLDSVSTLSYQDTVDGICKDFTNYQIGLKDQLGCISYSTIRGDTLRDGYLPAPPKIDSVSYDNSNNILIGWSESPDKDTKSYIIYYL